MSSSAASFFFYDLETSGFNPREQRIMQFAGQRTDSQLQPFGEPVNLLIKLTPEIVPDPDAIMLTGITPQATLADGLTEAEFLKYFYDEVVTPGTTFLGFNTVRFDDEFMRFLHYRNFYDPYEWQYLDQCSRWDVLDVVRMTRALRPDGIEWPFTSEGKPTNRLELLTKLNGLNHEAAHDALSDVTATIAVAKLIRDKQPKLFDFLFDCRQKKKVIELLDKDQPLVYASGKYADEVQKAAVVVKLVNQAQNRGAFVYDLRHDPSEFLAMTPQQLVERWQYTRQPDAPPRLPVKLLQYNHCPAIAPLGVLDETAWARLKNDLETVKRHRHILRVNPDFAGNILKAAAILDENQAARQLQAGEQDVDARLYDGFVGTTDKQVMRAVRGADASALANFADKLQDGRLKQLLPRYKARNYPANLSDDERRDWDEFCQRRIMDGDQKGRLALYFARLQELEAAKLDQDKSFLLEELQLYGQSLVPSDLDDQA